MPLLAPAPQDAARLQKPLQHEVSVTLKLVQVYVTDKKGDPVKDLNKEDFIVYDNGQAMTLTEFEKHILTARPEKPSPLPEEKIVPTPIPPAAQVTVMSRKFFLFFDFAFNNQKGVNKAKEAALHFIDTELIPGDEVGLLSYSVLKGLSIHEYLTTDHKKVREAVADLDTKDIAGRAEDFEEEYWLKAGGGGGTNPYAKSRSQLEAERLESKSQVQNFILKIAALAKALRYVPGKKHMILFSTGVMNSLIYYGMARQSSGAGMRSANPAWFNVDAGDYVLRTQNEEMLKELSAADCTVFTFDTREAAMIPSLFTYDQLTFEQRDRTIFTAAGATNPVDLFKGERITGHYSLSRLSNVTGGKYFSNINDYEKNLGQVQTMTGTYYVLGYYIGEQWDGRYHKIKVDVKRTGVEVRAQAGYFNPKPFREYSDLEKQLHLFDLALTERPLLQTPMRFSMTPLSYAAGEESRLEMLSKIPAAVIEKFSGKKVELVSLVFDEKGNLAGLQRTEADLAKYRGMNAFFTAGLSLEPGPCRCRLVIRDLDTGDGAIASVPANVAKNAFVGLNLYSPLLLVPEGNLAYLDAAGTRKEDKMAWTDAYPYDRAQYSPIIGDVPERTAKLFAVVPYSVAGLVQPNISMAAYLVNSVSGERIPLSFSILNKAEKGDIEIQFMEFPINNVPPGKYLLYVHAEDAATKSVSFAQTPLIIK